MTRMKIPRSIFVTSIFLTMSSTQNDTRMPPSITEGPRSSSFIFASGNSVRLDCKGKGVPGVTYEWTRNGNRLDVTLNNIIRRADGAITIQPAMSTDEGFYQCFVRNRHGTAITITAHVQLAFLDSTPGVPEALSQLVYNGLPFHISCDRRASFPKPIYLWEISNGMRDPNPSPLVLTERVQVAENGDLHFGYGPPANYRNQTFYRCFTNNTHLSVKEGGNYTQLDFVSRRPRQPNRTLGFFSESPTVALVGGRAVLRCFFYKNQDSQILWSGPGPGRSLPIKRYRLNAFNTSLSIDSITASDEGTYSCAASTPEGKKSKEINLRVEVEPTFPSVNDAPFDVNVTEGESFTFHCDPVAKPEAKIVWLQDGKELYPNHSSTRFTFSDDNRSLTIRDVCRDCVDRESKTDLMVIQCNASNVHGYAFAQGYLNVLVKSEAMIIGPEKVSVDFQEQKHFIFQCIAISDPSTPATLHWYKTEPYGDLVRDEPPYVCVSKEFLIIMFYPNCSSACAKYLGEYKCVVDNGHSHGSRAITINYEYKPQQDPVMQNYCEPWAVWKIILIAGTIGLVLFIIGIFIGFRRKTCFGSINKETKQLPNPLDTYERVDSESVGDPLEEMRENEGSMPVAGIMYEHATGYESIDHVLEDIANRDRVMPNPSTVHRRISYESIDTPQREAIDRDRAMLDKSMKYDDMGYAMPLEEIANRGEIDKNRVHGHDADASEFGNNSSSHEQREVVNTYSDKIRKDVNSYLQLVPADVNQYLDLCSNEENLHLEMDMKKVNPYLILVHKEENPYLGMVEKDVDPYLDMSKKDMDPQLDTSPCTVHAPASTTKREADYLVLKN